MPAEIPSDTFADTETARAAFAELLKIPRALPAVVDVERRDVREEAGLTVEDIAWRAPDGEEVPALVVSPATDGAGPFPAVVCLHGSGGSREEVCAPSFGRGPWTPRAGGAPYTTLLGWGRELARHGYVVLALTQRGLDVRTPDTNDRAKDLLVRGRTLMGAIVTEIRQAVTYLQSRAEVDPARIGMTGISFGGITTFYSWLVDERIAAAAPVCGGVGSVDVLLRRGVPAYHGFYWWIPDLLTRGDQGDFAAAQAPRPLMLWAPRDDIGMPREGVDRFLEAAQPAYERAGASAALVVHQPPGEHDFTAEAFAALRAFFDTHLKR
jgi:dienelactone hydrolase